MKPDVVLLTGSLGGNATAGIGVNVGDRQRHNASQHRIVNPIQLRDSDPLRCVTKLLRRNLEQVAASDCDRHHRQVLAYARLVTARPR